MVSTSEIKRGMILDLDNKLVKIMSFDHQKIGRGGAQVKIQLRDLRNGANFDRTFPAGAKFENVRLERVTAQFSYADGDDYHFMNTETFDQIQVNVRDLGDARFFIHEGDNVDIMTYQDLPIDVEIPPSVMLEVVETDPGVKGDTATGGTKPAKLDTGLTVNVPLFVNPGDKIKVDTRDKKYLERSN